nr:TaqI-like C-terminal specificity domain-containing protein [Enterococcus cecorum]
MNEAFIISKEKKDELIKADPKSAEIIRPILRGRDIKKNKVDFKEIYIINVHNGYTNTEGEYVPPIDINNYPSIKEWLEFGDWNKKKGDISNFNRLKKRTDQGITPYNLRSLSYMDDFNKQKIIYPNMTKYLPFYLDEEGYLSNQKAFILTGEHLYYLVSFFNSSLFKIAFNNNFPELQGGTRELSKIYFEKIAIKKPSEELESQIINLYKKITSDNDFDKLLISVDYTLSKYYNLSEDEINYLFQKYYL